MNFTRGVEGLKNFTKVLTGFLLLVLAVEALGFGSNQNLSLSIQASSISGTCFGFNFKQWLA